ncbi:MAG TPA: hypothetical protein PKB07_25705 [Flavilitoribacter sp.]|nr:hypothetical protein [Flavilitoribacter sp.]
MHPNRGHLNSYEEHIKNYLEGRLPEEEQQIFEEQLNANPLLAEDTRFLKNLIFTLKNPELVSTAQILLNFRNENLGYHTVDPNTVPPKFFLRKSFRLTIYAVAIFVLLLILIFTNTIIKADFNQIYNNNLSAYPSIFPVQTTGDYKLDLAIKDYVEKDWNGAEKNFKAYAKNEIIYSFYYAVSKLHSHPELLNENEAGFNALIIELSQKEDYQGFTNWSQYYIALIKIKKGEFKEGKRIVQQLKKNENLSPDLQKIIDKFNDELYWFWF